MRKPDLISDLPVPHKVDPGCQKAAEQIVDEIIELERRYLTDEQELFKQYASPESRDSAEFDELLSARRDRHNDDAGRLVGKIDQLFYNLFGLSEKQILMIEQVLHSGGLAVLTDPHQAK